MGNCRTRPRRQGLLSISRNPQSAFRISHRRYRGGERRPKFRDPQSAIRNPHFPPSCHLSFVISTAIGYWQSACLHSFSKNENRYFAQNHRIESPRID
jgi:hypothetical protein